MGQWAPGTQNANSPDGRGLGDKLGFFLMQLDTEWTLGLNSVAYGLVELEIEAGDSGLRSFVSVQSALCGHAIHAFGSEEQKREWLPHLASGEKLVNLRMQASYRPSAPRGTRRPPSSC